MFLPYLHFHLNNNYNLSFSNNYNNIFTLEGGGDYLGGSVNNQRQMKDKIGSIKYLIELQKELQEVRKVHMSLLHVPLYTTSPFPHPYTHSPLITFLSFIFIMHNTSMKLNYKLVISIFVLVSTERQNLHFYLYTCNMPCSNMHFSSANILV